MLSSIGSPRFTECSALLYGHPSTRYRSQDATTLDSARKMLEITDQLVDAIFAPLPEGERWTPLPQAAVDA